MVDSCPKKRRGRDGTRLADKKNEADLGTFGRGNGQIGVVGVDHILYRSEFLTRAFVDPQIHESSPIKHPL